MSNPMEAMLNNLNYYQREVERTQENMAWIEKYHLDEIVIPETAYCYTVHHRIRISNVANKGERTALISQVMDAAGVARVKKEDAGGTDMKIEIPFGPGNVIIEYQKPCAAKRYRVTTKSVVEEITICGELDASDYAHVELLD